MDGSILETTSMTRKKASGYSNGQMDASMKENESTGNSTAKGCSLLAMACKGRAFGIKGKDSSGLMNDD